MRLFVASYPRLPHSNHIKHCVPATLPHVGSEVQALVLLFSICSFAIHDSSFQICSVTQDAGQRPSPATCLPDGLCAQPREPCFPSSCLACKLWVHVCPLHQWAVSGESQCTLRRATVKPAVKVRSGSRLILTTWHLFLLQSHRRHRLNLRLSHVTC